MKNRILNIECLHYNNITIQGEMCEKEYIFGESIPFTLTAQAGLSNVRFEEEDLIYAIKPTGRIKKITCNYGESYNEDYTDPPPKIKRTNRGRKKKEKKKSVRKKKGNGKYFSSQITFWVESDTKPGKYYKIKEFRNGTTEIPGGLLPNMEDVRSAVEVVRDVLAECLAEDVEITELYSVMRNYKFRTLDVDTRINISVLYQIFIRLSDLKDKIMKGITRIKYNPERYPGLLIKFTTPIENNPKKETTIKMFKSGKVNIDGAVSEADAAIHYEWINDFYVLHKNEIVYRPYVIVDESSSSSSASINVPDDVTSPVVDDRKYATEPDFNML